MNNKCKCLQPCVQLTDLSSIVMTGNSEASKIRGEIASLRHDTNISLNKTREDIKELVDIMQTVQHFFKALGWLKTGILYIASFFVAVAAAYHAVEAFLKAKGLG